MPTIGWLSAGRVETGLCRGGVVGEVVDVVVDVVLLDGVVVDVVEVEVVVVVVVDVGGPGTVQ
jgi:hypothetical protein